MNDASSYIVPMNTNNIIESNRNSITDKPHNNKPITKIEISPGGRYLVTYSQEDHSVVGWNIEDVDEGQLKSNDSVKINYEINQICVSDDKKLAYINNDRTLLNIIDIRNNNQIKIDMRNYYRLKSFIEYFIDIRKYFKPYYCTFNSKGEFILFVLYRESHLYIYIYSTQSNNNDLKCKRIYELPEDFELTELITRYDKLYLFSNDYAYEWNSITGNFIRMFWMKTKDAKDVRISSNGIFICLRIEDEIIIYSIELRIPIATLDINNDIQLYNFMKHTGSCLVLLQLFDRIPNKGIWKSIMDYCWKKSLDRLNIENPLPNNILTTNNYGFGILDGNVQKIKVENVISKINFPLQISDEIIDNWYDYSNNYYSHFRIKEDFKLLNAHLFSPYMNAIRKLFVVASSNYYVQKRELEFNQWKIKIDDEEIELRVLKDKWYRTSTKFDSDYSNFEKYLISSSLFDNGDILILTTIGLFIYHFNEDNKSISLNYYYHMYLKYLKYMEYMNFIPGLLGLKLKRYYYYHYYYYYYKKLKFSTPTLPLLNYESFKLNDEWTSYLIDNKSSLLKYGVELLSFSIKEHKFELIEDIYKKCIIYFRQDLRNNSKFLSIITSTMPLLNEHFPEYILRYSLETAMIIDSPIYSLKHRNINLHLYSFFKHPPKVNLIHPPILCAIYTIYIDRFISMLPPIPLIVLYYVTYALVVISILFLALFISNHAQIFSIIFSISTIILIYFIYKIYLIHSRPSIPTITFMISYIKFVNYPRDYNYIFDLFWPKPSPFVNIINRDIYKTWNGEALINFKWNAYGKYYYFIICNLFMALFLCFTAVATIPQDYLNENLKRNVLKTSITLGSFHLIQEIRQFIYNPKKWFLNYWNFFDLGAYLIPTATSIYWLHSNNENTSLLSFSCLLLDIKFLLFFRAFESFGIYFAIIVGVAKQLISFLVILFIIIISFAHAFFVLLKPKLAYVLDQPTINNDPNNPWNLNTTYYNQINGTTAQNASFIQAPDENTNMFTDYGTALFAIYLFLTGDPSALSNKWAYKEHPALIILIVLFSFMIVVYLMNLFIGLLNKAIEKDNNRISYLMQKAEILVEIELFYLLPHQRRWEAWFPEVIHYYADVVKAREKVKEMISKGEWNINDFPELKKDLLDKLNIQYNPVNSEIIRRDA